MKIDMVWRKIMNKRKKNLILIAAILCAAAAGLGWTLSGQGTEAQIISSERGDIQRYVEEIGEVKCENTATVYLEGSGLIKNVAVEEGQKVKKGDLLLSLDREQSEISLRNAAELLNQARAQYAAGEESYTTALKDYNNTRYLAEEGAASQWELTQKEAALKSAEAVRSGYKASLEQAELNMQNNSLELDRQQILSPINGTVLEKKVELNGLGTPGTEAFIIGDTDNIEIKAKILAEDAAGIRVGNEAEIVVRMDGNPVMEGTVTKVAPTAGDEVSSLGVRQKKVEVTIKPLKSEISLKPGSEVDVKVITETKSNVIIVPTAAVFDYQGESCVFTVEEGKAVLRAVKRGIRNESFVEITDGLEAGETVLASPDNSIEEGMRIKAERMIY